eukprot:gnl/Dysnectes_brevis/2070_a2393_2352.p1 GENE.gnl/Dysnectes_brevis/2070_a2393_2352~~gnl/Dysnectes_brevis/2070_a2393_2352.p1  ORF type:complete len:273 (-),score=73.93 gnl/Dysnectes_brevis/2070_a2393_2352:36-776(-)
MGFGADLGEFRGDAPQTSVWADIFDKKNHGATAQELYEIGLQHEAETQEKTRSVIRLSKMIRKIEEASDSDISESDISGLSDIDESDEAFFEAYKQRRVENMQREAGLPYFGEVTDINAPSYTQSVKEDKVHVVVHLSEHSLPACKLVHARLRELAVKFPHLKILRIKATDAIRDYPTAACPTLLIYYQGEVKKQLVGLPAIGGRSLTTDQLEWVLSREDAIETKLSEDPRAKAASASSRLRAQLY